MRSLERKFQELQKSNVGLGSYIIFANTITDEGFSPDIIRRWFNLLVDKEDYLQSEKRGLFANLNTLSNGPRSTGIEGKLASRGSSIHISVS